MDEVVFVLGFTVDIVDVCGEVSVRVGSFGGSGPSFFNVGFNFMLQDGRGGGSSICGAGSIFILWGGSVVMDKAAVAEPLCCCFCFCCCCCSD